MRPIIGITTGHKKDHPRQLELYGQAVEDAGAAAFFIGPDADIMEIAAGLSGFLIPGGRDIESLLYNEQRIAEVEPEGEERVNFDINLLHAARKREKPVLGICYGMQLINVLMGGSLYQDINIQKHSSTDHRNGNHRVEIIDNPYIKTGVYELNSSHHQAVKEIGTSLNAFAFSPEGIIEGFYLPGAGFLMGVQWHPERMKNRVTEEIFSYFVEACRERK